MQAAVVKADMNQISWTMKPYQSHLWLLCCRAICRVEFLSHKNRVKKSEIFLIRVTWVYRRQNPILLNCYFFSHHSTSIHSNSDQTFGCFALGVRRGAKSTHTAIKDDNSAVQVGNFGHGSAILLTFIGSNQCLLDCINSGRGAQSASQTSQIRITQVSHSFCRTFIWTNWVSWKKYSCIFWEILLSRTPTYRRFRSDSNRKSSLMLNEWNVRLISTNLFFYIPGFLLPAHHEGLRSNLCAGCPLRWVQNSFLLFQSFFL